MLAAEIRLLLRRNETLLWDLAVSTRDVCTELEANNSVAINKLAFLTWSMIGYFLALM